MTTNSWPDLDALLKRIEELERRVAELEKTTPRYTRRSTENT